MNHREATDETIRFARTAAENGKITNRDLMMLEKMALGAIEASPAQQGRVLGFIQGFLYGNGEATLAELKAIIERNRGGAR